MAPVCVPCKVFMRPERNGTAFEEGRFEDGDTSVPYKLWIGDLFKCPDCGAQVISGFGREPMAHHYEPDYAALVTTYKPILRTKDQ